MKAQLSGDAALIAHLRLEIAKLTRTLYGQRSERTQRLIDQYELQLEELEASPAAVPAPAERRKPSRLPFPAHLPRVRVVVPGPTACPCCCGTRLSRLGEDVTETLEVVPRRWTVIQTVRERFLLPRLRGRQPGTRALPRRAAGMGGPEPARHGAVREVRPAPCVSNTPPAMEVWNCEVAPVRALAHIAW